MIIKQLTGRLIHVTYRDVMVKVTGKLLECDEYFVCIDLGDNKPNVFIPLTSILHLEPVNAE